MNEAICLARNRKSGKWEVLSNPDASFTDANTAFNKVSAPVSEDYDHIIIGKITHTRPAQRPVSAKQNEARLAQVSEQSEKVAKIAGTARERQAGIEADRVAELRKAQIGERDHVNSIVEKIRKATGYKHTPVAA